MAEPTNSMNPIRPTIEDEAVDMVSECAIDETEEVNDHFVLAQRAEKIQAEQRLHPRATGPLRVQDVVPFRFSPNFLPLTISNWEACVALENAGFTNPQHRCTPEKFEYRLTKCPGMCFGIFCTIPPEQAKDFQIETMAVSKPVETGRKDGALHVLCAHAISTMGKAPVVTDDDMDWPRDWKDPASKRSGVGHQEEGRTACLHSLVVLPKLQGCGLGRLAMKSYLQIMNDSGIADRVALICEDHLINYYLRFGFKHLGESKAQFGGGGWHDLVFDLPGPASKNALYRQ